MVFRSLLEEVIWLNFLLEAVIGCTTALSAEIKVEELYIL